VAEAGGVAKAGGVAEAGGVAKAGVASLRTRLRGEAGATESIDCENFDCGMIVQFQKTKKAMVK